MYVVATSVNATRLCNAVAGDQEDRYLHVLIITPSKTKEVSGYNTRYYIHRHNLHREITERIIDVLF
jgi:hypothetical protein